MRYLSVCSGIESASVAFEPLGWVPVAFAEIDPFACAVLKHRFPHVPNLGDFTKIGLDDVGAVDLIVGGTPCFGAGTLILTKQGFHPIEEVKIGDMVLTHKGRYRPVTAVGSKIAPTVKLCAQGTSGTITTKEHRFLVADVQRWATHENGKSIRKLERHKEEWREISKSIGSYVASPQEFPSLIIPPISLKGREFPFEIKNKQDFFWIIGAWVGNGWVQIDRRRGRAVISARKGKKAQEMAEHLSAGIYNFCEVSESTSQKFHIASRPLARWLSQEFGSGAVNKQIPSWLLGSEKELRGAFMEGYLATDGCIPLGKPYMSFTTVSRKLAFGIRMLAQSLGFSVSVHLHIPPTTCIIEGRTVNQRPLYTIRVPKDARSSWARDSYRFGLVRKVEETGSLDRVYDITVEEDHSYVADGFCVHNCQDFSVAGLRAGMDGKRGQLTIEFIHLLERIRPRWVVWENVPGVLSSDDGRAFGTFLGALGKLGYGFAYRILNAEYFGVPQRRNRVFVVGYLGDWRPPAAVLFNKDSLCRNPPPSRKTGEIAAPLLASGVGAGGGASDNSAIANHLVANALTGNAYADRAGEETNLIAHTLRGEGFDASEDGTGRGIPLVAAFLGGQSSQARSLAYSESVFPTLKAASSGTNQVPSIVAVVNGNSTPEVSMDIAMPLRANDGSGNRQAILAFDTTQITSPQSRSHPKPGDPCHPLAAAAHAPAIAFQPKASVTQSMSIGETCPTIGTTKEPGVYTRMAIRRLTPTECERLQNFPDNFTLVPYRRKLAKDGPRYRAIGNSMCTSVMSWIGKRIQLVEEIRNAKESCSTEC